MNTFLRSIVSIYFIAFNLISPFASFIISSGENLEVDQSEKSIVDSSIGSIWDSDRPTLDEEFDVLNSSKIPAQTTPTTSPTPKPTIESTEIPTDGTKQPEGDVPVDQPVNESFDPIISTDKEYLIAGEEVEVEISPINLPEGVQLKIEASKGLSPKDDFGENYNAEKNILDLPDQAQSVVWQTEASSQGPFYFIARIMKGEDVLDEQLIALDQAIAGKATPKGGKIEWPDKGVSVTFPEGAVSEDVELIIRQAIVHPIAPFNLSGHSIILSAVDDQENQKTKFLKAVTLEISYDPEEYAGNEYNIFIKFYDEEEGIWSSVPTLRDIDNHKVSAKITHFSEWDLDALTWEAARLPSLNNFNTQGFTGGITFDFPFEVPSGPGGFSPNLNLTYNSTSVDGINVKMQAGWTGMGWTMEVGAIVRNMHGTSSETIDDTFNIDLGNISGLLIQEETDPAENIVYYHLQDEDFSRIQYYRAEDTWVVWEKNGTKYVFGGRYDANGTLINDEMSGAFFPTTCDGTHAKHPTWYWGVRQIVDKYNQKIEVEWERVARTLNNYCGTGSLAYVILDTKPVSLTYSNNGYRILFDTTNNRKDHDTDWHIGFAIYSVKNLDKIIVQKKIAGQWEDVYFYDLIYAQDISENDPTYNNYVFPNYHWYYTTGPFIWERTLSLVGIKKCYSAGNCDPAYSFEYGDGMHLTAAENGQGGRIEYTYSVIFELESIPALQTGSARLCGHYGDYGTFGWSGNCTVYSSVWYLLVITSSTKGIPTNLNEPGSFYKFFAKVSIAGHGDSEDYFRAKLLLDGSTTCQSAEHYLTNSVWAPRSFNIYLRLKPYQTTRVAQAQMLGSGLEYCPDPSRVCHGTAAFAGIVQPVLTKYRVVEKTIIDQISGDEYTYTYTYNEFATNDPEHSDIVAYSPYHCGFNSTDGLDDEALCYTPIYAEFRGHASSTETDPSGKTTINYYHQDDAKKGRNAANMTVVSQYGDNFENGLNTNQWDVHLSGGSNDQGTVVRYFGDKAFKLREGEPTESSNVLGTSTTSPDGRSILVQFRPQEAGSEFTVGVRDSTNPAYKYQIRGTDSGLIIQYGNGTNVITASTLISAANGYTPDQWYVAIFTLDDEEGYSVRVWKRSNPGVRGYYNIAAATAGFTSNMSWRFLIAIKNGTIYIDEYMEAYVYALNLNFYGAINNPNGIVTDPPNYYRWAMGDFPGFVVRWVWMAGTESYVFEGGSGFQATRTNYTYDDNPKHGNLIGIREMAWDGSGFANVRQTNINYYPTDTTTTYLPSLPAKQEVYACTGSICDQDLLAITQTIYDSNTAYNQSPTIGEITRIRKGVDQNTWADTLMDYDAYGNQTSLTQYTGYGTDAAFASVGAQTTTTTYDTELHTYPVTVTPAITSHQVTMTYNTLLGLPESMTDPNGLVTLLCYDNKARLVGMVKGDSGNPPTCNSQMEISMTYHDAFENAGVWSSFWTEASQVLSLDGQGAPDLEITYRKFYDGIGRQIQTQTVGVDLDGYTTGTQTIVNDFFYNPNGLLEYSSMPYNVTTPAGHYSPAACTTDTCVRTIYDALGREIQTQSPDGAVTQTLYGFDSTDGLRTVSVTDTNQNSTTSFQDVWGQTVRVLPETGPWTEYIYDLAGQLTQVDQVSATGTFASTYMAYDMGGRKLEMSDADMGVWTYAYDALGNLTSQTDANLQQINLCYDDLNRLTGKFYGGSGDCSTPAGWDVTYHYDAYTAGIFSGYTGPTTNALGQRTGMLDGSGQTIWSYDQRGNLIQEEKLIGAESFTTEWVYSVGGLLEQTSYPQVDSVGETIYTTYHPQGSVASVGSSLPAADPPEELSSTYIPLLANTMTELLLVVPDPTNEPSSALLGYPISNGDDSPDPAAEKIKVEPLEMAPNLITSVDGLLITMTYDEAGRIVNRNYDDYADGLQSNFEYYDWDEQVYTVPQGGLLQSAQTGNLADPDSLVSLAYIYDAVGNIVSISDLIQTPAQTQNFVYDSIYRLTSTAGSAGFGGAYSESYTFDNQGRMDSKDGSKLNYGATRVGTCQSNSLTPSASSSIAHAVSSKNGGNSYSYDCNGNAVTRGDQTLIYDEENRLMEVKVSSMTIAEYMYDGDGNRVQATVTGGGLTITTTFIGLYYEQITTDDGNSTTTEWKKYYYAGSVRLAMRENSDDPLYLIGDHLGSTSLVLDTSGQEIAQQSYLPFGEIWGVSANDLPTTFTFTGQREAAEIGLMYYVARWYDSEIGHFIQADTLIENEKNVPAWNRYAYVSFNPLNSTDPTGHMVDDEGSYNPWKKTVRTEEGLYDLAKDIWVIENSDPTTNFNINYSHTTDFGFTTVLDFTTGSGVEFTVTYTIDDEIDLYIDAIGISGDIISFVTFLDPALGDEIPGLFAYLCTEGIEVPGVGKALYDASQGDFHNLLYDSSSDNITKTVENYAKITNDVDLLRLSPVIGFIFNIISISENVDINVRIDEGKP